MFWTYFRNFAVFCVFLWISRDFADLPQFRGSATARNIRTPVLRRRTWRRGLWNSPYSSPGDWSMHARAFVMFLLWSKKEYGLLKSNLLRLGLRGFSNNGLTYYELRIRHERKSSRSVSCFARVDCSLRKGVFHSIRESEICFVLRIIKRNYKLQFSGLTVEKVSIPIIEPVSSLKQSIFWNVGGISDFVDWNVQRDASTLVEERSNFSKTAFSHKVWPIHLKSMNNFDV